MGLNPAVSCELNYIESFTPLISKIGHEQARSQNTRMILVPIDFHYCGQKEGLSKHLLSLSLLLYLYLSLSGDATNVGETSEKTKGFCNQQAVFPHPATPGAQAEGEAVLVYGLWHLATARIISAT